MEKEIIIINCRLDKEYNRIEIYFWKWRPIRYYQGNNIPSMQIQQEVIHSISLNTGYPENLIKLKW